jgi:hypothetical protein
MLRSDAELALDEAVLAVSEAARLHREAAHNGAATIRPGLAEAADLRERIAEELAEAARKAGWLPRAPDPDADAARTLAEEVQLAVAGTEDAPLQAERRGADREALNRLDRLLAEPDLPSHVAAVATRGRNRLKSEDEASD